MDVDTSHLVALHESLGRERIRLAQSKTPQEREMRRVWLAQKQKEVDAELKHLGLSTAEEFDEISDEELLRELSS